MKLKKVISLCLAAAMAASMLAACGSTGTEEKAPASSAAKPADKSSAAAPVESEDTTITFPLAETVTFTAMSHGYKDGYPLAENPAWIEAQERANIKIDILYEPPRSEAPEKMKLVMAGGDYPEIIWKANGIGLDNLNQYGTDGVLIPLEDLIKEYMPNLTAMMDERDAWYTCEAPDGHIYTLPMFEPTMIQGHSDGAWWINEQWMKNVGVEMPTSMEELYNVLKAFKEQDANGNGDPDDEIPMSFYGGVPYNIISYTGDGLYYLGQHVSIKDGELVYYPYEEGFKEWVTWMNKMYAEGLIDVNAFTQEKEQQLVTIQSGNVVGMCNGTTQGYAVLPEYQIEYTALLPFDADNFAYFNGTSAGAFCITDKCQNPEIILSWVDYFYTEEGAMLANLGVEGVHWEWVDKEAGTFNSLVKDDPEKYPHWGAYNLQGAALYPSFRPLSMFLGDASMPENDPAAYKANVEKYGEGGLYDVGVVVPTLKFTEDEVKDRTTLETDINGYINNYVAQVITGEKSLDTWDEFQSTLKSMRADELFAIYQAAYGRATE